MSKLIHIVFGGSAGGIMRYFFENNHNEFKGKVVVIMDDYSIGLIFEMDTEVGMKKEFNGLKKFVIRFHCLNILRN